MDNRWTNLLLLILAIVLIGWTAYLTRGTYKRPVPAVAVARPATPALAVAPSPRRDTMPAAPVMRTAPVVRAEAVRPTTRTILDTKPVDAQILALLQESQHDNVKVEHNRGRHHSRSRSCSRGRSHSRSHSCKK